MIDDVLCMLRDKLNGYLKYRAEASSDIVSFIDGMANDTLTFPPNKVVPMLINLDEDKTLRQVDLFEARTKNRIKTNVNSTVCINLLVIFICRFDNYTQSLKFLSLIIRFFQRNQQLDHANTPDLHADIDRLKIELVTLPVSQQNEIWSSIRTPFTPSVLYKISMLVFEDTDSIEVANQQMKETITTISGI
jgi:hypothetical protein